MALFDYKDILEVDLGTYTLWQPRIQEIEDAAILTAKNLNKDMDQSADNELLERYCKERVFVELLGQSLPLSIMTYHTNLLKEYEAAMRYVS